MKRLSLYWTFICALLLCCANSGGQEAKTEDAGAPEKPKTAQATFAGGCFWCMESPFEKLDGVKSVVSGYAGGHVKNPTYKQVCGGATGHLEVIQVTYDPSKVSYEKLLYVFWRQIDPTDGGGSFVDRGPQYASAIFYHNDEQKAAAEASKAALNKSRRFKRPVATAIRSMPKFYPAEEYHQDYYKKSAAHYNAYRRNSGRDQFIARAWGSRSGR